MGEVLPFLQPPAVVVVYLQAPRERYWGVVRGFDAAGLLLQGTDLNSFEDWLRQVVAREPNSGPSTMFFPMTRIEKILIDEPAGDHPSLAQQFERRVGRRLIDHLAR
ncbi:MAG TPA: hypothetical protein VFB49_12150 [Patescibacteria group bacterium]|nr:hypothetical protein [Patescibacteria group bacterium]